MPKMKTHKGAQKRFRATGSGKLVRMKGHASHLRRKTPKSVKRAYSSVLPLNPADEARIRRVLPYISK